MNKLMEVARYILMILGVLGAVLAFIAMCKFTEYVITLFIPR